MAGTMHARVRGREARIRNGICADDQAVVLVQVDQGCARRVDDIAACFQFSQHHVRMMARRDGTALFAGRAMNQLLALQLADCVLYARLVGVACAAIAESDGPER
ncbi:hypothetical protein ACFSUK_08060 [Sphingobium scionense]